MDTATQGTTESATGVSLEFLARSMAGLDHDSRVTVIRRADQMANAIDREFAADEAAYTKARDLRGGTPLGALRPDDLGLQGYSAQELGLGNVEDAFRYQPWDPHQQERGERVRELLVLTAKAILRNVPRSPLRTRALNRLVDARMLANAAITFGGRF